MSKTIEAEPRSVDVGNNTFTFGKDGWSANRLELLRLLTVNPEAVEVMAEARVAYSVDSGKVNVVSPSGWKVDMHSGLDRKPKNFGGDDPRVQKLKLETALRELYTSTSMTEFSWLQPFVDLERVTGSTHQDFMFVAGINELQRANHGGSLATEQKRVAAFTDIISRNPVDFFGGSYRLTRNIQLREGQPHPVGEHFRADKFGPNIRKGAGFGLVEKHADEWVAWSWTFPEGVFSYPAELHPINEIVSVTENLPGGVDGLVIPTYVGEKLSSVS